MKRVFKYLQDTFRYSIFYHSDVSRKPHLAYIHGYVDSYWVGDVNRRRSTSICAISLFGATISSMNKQQEMISFSTMWIEYMITTHTCKDTI